MVHVQPLAQQSLQQQWSITAAEPERRGIELLSSDDQTDETFDHSPAHRITRLSRERRSSTEILRVVARIRQRLRACRHGLQLQRQSSCQPATVESTISAHPRQAEHGAGINNHQGANLG